MKNAEEKEESITQDDRSEETTSEVDHSLAREKLSNVSKKLPKDDIDLHDTKNRSTIDLPDTKNSSTKELKDDKDDARKSKTVAIGEGKPTTIEKIALMSPAQEFKCPPCGKTFNSYGVMVKHLATCPSAKTCCLCNLICKTRNELEKHFEKEHSDYCSLRTKPLEESYPTCNVCGKPFINKENLNRHMSNAHRQPREEDAKKASKVTFSAVVDTNT